MKSLVSPLPPPPSAAQTSIACAVLASANYLNRPFHWISDDLRSRFDALDDVLQLRMSASQSAAIFDEAARSNPIATAYAPPPTPPVKERGAACRKVDSIQLQKGINPELAYTVKQAADFLQLSEDTIMSFCRRRMWKCSAQRNAYRIKGSVILDWLDGK
jgi:hypothetical protein